MDFQQHYPSYKFKHRDVVLSEFEEAQKNANTQSKLYGQLANLLIAFITISITVFVKSNDTSYLTTAKILRDNILLLFIFLVIVGGVILRYFVELQRTIVINSRKVITLRRILGLDYGNIQLTIPNWRIEGATNPFEIKLFPGWFRFGSSPFWIIVLALNVLWIILYRNISYTLINQFWYFINAFLSITFAIIYRIQLNELHETFYLNVVKTISRLCGIRLEKKFEYILYRVKLSVFERKRLEYDIELLKEILIEIEDIRFKKHKGVDFKSIVRAFFSIFRVLRIKKGLLRNGGSTITMQLCRTLFIPSNQNKIFRKLIEILLAFWLDKQFSKEEILDFYLSSVRFDKGIHGVISATKHFFPDRPQKKFTYEEAFFLVERLSNITSSYKIERIKSLFERIPSKEKINYKRLTELYKNIEKTHVLKLLL